MGRVARRRAMTIFVRDEREPLVEFRHDLPTEPREFPVSPVESNRELPAAISRRDC